MGNHMYINVIGRSVRIGQDRTKTELDRKS